VTPTPPLPSQVMGIPLMRRPYVTRGPDAVAWRARCPHGAEGEWRAVRDDTRAKVTVECPCRDDPIEPRWVGLPWTVA
jgi:nitrite reductase/ring-hydroxylating ferredoxin subunit